MVVVQKKYEVGGFIPTFLNPGDVCTFDGVLSGGTIWNEKKVGELVARMKNTSCFQGLVPCSK